MGETILKILSREKNNRKLWIKEQAKDALIELYEQQIMDLTLMSKIELGDDVIAEIKRLKELIRKHEQPG